MAIAVPSLASTTGRYLRGCIRAYFEETKNLTYVLGAISGARPQARTIVETRFSQYAGTQRYRDLMEKL